MQETGLNQSVRSRYENIHIGGSARAQLGDSTQNVNISIHGASEQSFQEQKIAFIKSLSYAGADNRYHVISEGIENSCQWLTKLHRYTTWRTANRSSGHDDILWIKGKPGAGKSTLMKHALRDADNHYDQLSPNDSNGPVGDLSSSGGAATQGTTRVITISFFFNARGGRYETSPEGLLRSMLHQLCLKGNTVDPALVRKYAEKQKYYASGWEWSESELQQMLRSMLATNRGLRTLVFVDALDECEHGRIRDLVRFLKSVVPEATRAGADVRMCISSRHYPNIHTLHDSTIVVEHGNEQDISTYTTVKLQDMGRYSEEFHHTITSKAAGVFLWPVLVLQKLHEAVEDGETQRTMSALLASMPKDLEHLFSDLLVRIDENERPSSIMLMLWVLFARRPLTVTELRYAVSFDARHVSQRECESSDSFITSDDDAEKLLRKWSRGLVEVRIGDDGDSIVQFVHESVREFLLFQKGLNQLADNLSDLAAAVGNFQHAMTCFNYLSISDLPDFMEGGSTGYLSEHSRWFGDDGIFRRYPFIHYALDFAIEHVSEAEKHGQETLEILQRVESMQIANATSWIEHRNGWTRNRDTSKPTLLYVVCEAGLRSWLRSLLARKVDVNGGGGQYGHGLLAATSFGHKDVAAELLENGANADVRLGSVGTALTLAASKGFTEIATSLLTANASLHVKGDTGTPLIIASARGDSHLVKLLLDWGDSQEGWINHCGEILSAVVASIHHGKTDTTRVLKEKLAQLQRLHLLDPPVSTSDEGDRDASGSLSGRSPAESMESRTRRAITVCGLREMFVPLSVKTLTAKRVTVNIWLDEPCSKLKEKIEEKEGIRPDQQYLIHDSKYNTRGIPDDALLFNTGVRAYSRIEMTIRFKACGPHRIHRFRDDYSNAPVEALQLRDDTSSVSIRASRRQRSDYNNVLRWPSPLDLQDSDESLDGGVSSDGDSANDDQSSAGATRSTRPHDRSLSTTWG